MNKLIAMCVGTFATSVFLAFPAMAEDTDAKAVIKAHVEALGGKAAIQKVKTLSRSGKATMDGVFGNMSGTFEEKMVAGKKSYTLLDLGVFTEKQGWNGATGWKDNSMEGISTLEGEDLETLKAAVFVDLLAEAWMTYGDAAIIGQPQEAHEGTTYDVLKIAEVDEVTFYLDRKTHHLAGLVVPFEDPQMGEGVILVTMEDYTKEGDLMLPGKQTVDIADGTIVIKYEYQKTEINETIDAAVFEKP